MPSNSPDQRCSDSGQPVTSAAISRVLHDMAQPLTMLIGMLELTLIRPQSESEWRMSVEGALEQAGRTVEYLNQVRELVHLQRSGESAAGIEVLANHAVSNPVSGKVGACPAR